MFEVPVSLRGRKVEVRFDPFTYERMELYVEEKKVGDATPLGQGSELTNLQTGEL